VLDRQCPVGHRHDRINHDDNPFLRNGSRAFLHHCVIFTALSVRFGHRRKSNATGRPRGKAVQAGAKADVTGPRFIAASILIARTQTATGDRPKLRALRDPVAHDAEKVKGQGRSACPFSRTVAEPASRSVHRRDRFGPARAFDCQPAPRVGPEAGDAAHRGPLRVSRQRDGRTSVLAGVSPVRHDDAEIPSGNFRHPVVADGTRPPVPASRFALRLTKTIPQGAHSGVVQATTPLGQVCPDSAYLGEPALSTDLSPGDERGMPSAAIVSHWPPDWDRRCGEGRAGNRRILTICKQSKEAIS
jgi:hypothetical protein